MRHLNELINLQTKEIVADDSLSSEIEQQLTKRNILLSKQSEILKKCRSQLPDARPRTTWRKTGGCAACLIPADNAETLA